MSLVFIPLPVGLKKNKLIHHGIIESTKNTIFAFPNYNEMAEYKKLTRSRTDRRIAGVCGGLAQYLNVDSTVVRIVFLILLFFVGGGLLIYLIIWLCAPEEA